jgi:hypothetical protein
MAGAFDYQPQIMSAREIDRRGNITGFARSHRVSAWRRRPRIKPSGNLRARRMVA